MWKVLKSLPQPAAPAPIVPDAANPPDIPSGSNRIGIRTVHTPINGFGLFREYIISESISELPDNMRMLTDMSYQSKAHLTAQSESCPSLPPYMPFKNKSMFRILNWMWTGSHIKSLDELNRLVHEVILPDGFNINNLRGFNAAQETGHFDHILETMDLETMDPGPQSAISLLLRDTWHESVVCIPIPDGLKHKSSADRPIPIFDIHSLHHRLLTSIIRSAWTETPSYGYQHNETASQFHFVPFQHFWQREPGVSEAICDEVYTSEAFIKEYEAVQNLPSEPDCSLKWTVCALMFWSDLTHLATFGTASLWPIYLSFGNQMKYSRGCGQGSALHHVAYIPKVCLVDCCHSLLI